MISRLVRTELESYLHDLVVWGGTVFFLLVLFLSFMGTVVARSGDPLSDYLSGLFLLSVGLSSVLLAVKVSGRNAIEKRTRLFSQLPVSTREVSFASWCVRLLWLSIPTLAFTVFFARAANMPFATFALVTLATYLGGTTLVAAISVAMSIRHLPSPMSAWANGVYIACAIVAVVHLVPREPARAPSVPARRNREPRGRGPAGPDRLSHGLRRRARRPRRLVEGPRGRLSRMRSNPSSEGGQSMPHESRGLIPNWSTFWVDTKLGLRMLRKHWALTLIGGVAMTAAITLGASMFNFVQAVSGTKLPLEEGDRVVILQPWNAASRTPQAASMDDFERWRRELQSVVDTGAFRRTERNLITDAGPAGPISVAEMSAAGFRVARVAPRLGRFFIEDDERAGAPPVVVIGYNVWRSRFAADPEVIGRRVQLDGTFHTITGVMPRGLRLPGEG